MAPRKIPEGKFCIEIPVDSAATFPIRAFKELGVKPVQVIADRYGREDEIRLGLGLKPLGCKTARHPQIVFYIKGNYHLETLSHYKTNPFNWKTWFHFYIDVRDLKGLIDALTRIQSELE